MDSHSFIAQEVFKELFQMKSHEITNWFLNNSKEIHKDSQPTQEMTKYF